MQILFINNQGAGFADYIDIEVNTSVSALFQQKMTHSSPSDFLIRVNRQPVASDYVLREGDRVSITPCKIEGACCQLAAQTFAQSCSDSPVYCWSRHAAAK